jgi:hypothetical protein
MQMEGHSIKALRNKGRGARSAYLSAVFTERPMLRCRLINLRPDLVFIRARKPIARLRFNLLIRWG